MKVVKWIKNPIKKGLKRNFCLVIVIGIVAYLSKLMKKAAPIAAACLVVAIPLAGICTINVVSAQEDNPSQYQAIDLPLIEQQEPDFVSIFSESKVHKVGDELYYFKGYGIPLKKIGPYGNRFFYYDTAPLIYGEDYCTQQYYSTLLAILMEAELDTNSKYSIHNEDFLNKYCDSLLSDAKRGLKVAGESMMPTPEGLILNKISKGVYGDISDINTATQIGVILNNMTETSVKMLEETRKTSSTAKPYEYNPYNWKIDGVKRDAVTYYTLKGERIKRRAEAERNEEIKNAYKSLHLVPTSNRLIWYLKDSGGNQLDFITNTGMDKYLNDYGLSLPEALDFIDMHITPEEKRNLAKIKEIARDTYFKTTSGELVALPPTYKAEEISNDPSPYKYLGSSGPFVTQLRKVSFNYQQFVLEDTYVRVPAPMVPYITYYTPEEFQNYLDDLVYEIKNIPPELRKEGHNKRKEYFNLWHKERVNLPSGISKKEYNLWQKELLRKILQPTTPKEEPEKTLDFEIWKEIEGYIQPEPDSEKKRYHAFFFGPTELPYNDHRKELNDQAECYIDSLWDGMHRNLSAVPALKTLKIAGENYIQIKVNETYYAFVPEPEEIWDSKELQKSVHCYIDNMINERQKSVEEQEAFNSQQENIPTSTPAPVTPKPSSSPTKELTPGFEVIFAIVGLSVMAYLLRRRK